MINRKHNYTSIEQYKDDDGRVKITPEVMKLLRPTPTDDPNKVKKKSLKIGTYWDLEPQLILVELKHF